MENLLKKENKPIVRPFINKPKVVVSRKVKAGAIVLGILAIVALAYMTVMGVNNWFDKNYFQFNKPIEVKLNKPIEIKARKISVTQIIQVLNEIQPLENLTPIEKYICEKWGVYDCKTALAIAKAESGMREDAFHANTNNSIDVGIFQINSTHFKQPGCSLKEVSDMYKNVDCAYTIWKASGWNPWSVFNNGSFRNHIE